MRDGGPARTRTWDQGEFVVAIIQPLTGQVGETRVNFRCKTTDKVKRLCKKCPWSAQGRLRPEGQKVPSVELIFLFLVERSKYVPPVFTTSDIKDAR